MAGGKIETDPAVLAHHCDNFMNGTKRKYEAEGRGDMWLFELYHHLSDCASALRRVAVEVRSKKPTPQSEHRGSPKENLP